MFQLLDTQLLENSLDAGSLRQQVIANNIANINTAGYQAQTVTFEAELRQAMDEEDPEAARQIRPQVEAQVGRTGIHNEMASLAKNQIMYNALSTKISGMFAALKWVVENAGR